MRSAALKYAASAVIGALLALPASAQASETAIAASPMQETCITIMATFPNSGHVSRYQFFKLAKDLAQDSGPDLRAATAKYGDGIVAPDTPITEVIENIANPVLRQAAPEVTVSQTAHLINFANDCRPYVDGQIKSLMAFDSTLSDGEFNKVISEDALFLRQVLSDSLLRLGADKDPLYGPAVNRYGQNLVRTRDNIEFTAYAADVDEIESLFMADLDGRLARSNDVINKEMDREILSSSVQLSDDMNRSAEAIAERSKLQTLINILGRY